MSTKEQLHKIVDELSEDEAVVLLSGFQGGPWALTAEDRAAIDEGRAQLAAGQGVPHQEALRRLGLAR